MFKPDALLLSTLATTYLSDSKSSVSCSSHTGLPPVSGERKPWPSLEPSAQLLPGWLLLSLQVPI